MEMFVLWTGFIGAWLLVAGPILQAALELKEEDLERERIHAAQAKITTPRHVSNWWWLLPPVKFLLEQRQARKFQAEYMSVLDPRDVEDLVTFINKARGWLFVAGGAFLFALKETYELAEKLDWPIYSYWAVVVVLGALSLLNTIRSLRVVKKIRR